MLFQQIVYKFAPLCVANKLLQPRDLIIKSSVNPAESFRIETDLFPRQGFVHPAWIEMRYQFPFDGIQQYRLRIQTHLAGTVGCGVYHGWYSRVRLC